MNSNILIIGKNSFIAKNFIHNFNKTYNLFFFDYYFRKKDKKFLNRLSQVIKKNKIKIILNFAADNNNSLETDNFDSILESNFYLPLDLFEISNKFKITLFLFLSKDMDKNNNKKSFYSLSKDMLKIFVTNVLFKCKLRLLRLDSIYGPFDFNANRIFPSILSNIHKKTKIPVRLNHSKSFTFVDEVNKTIISLLKKNDNFIYKDLNSSKFNINKASKMLNKKSKINLKNLHVKYHPLLSTSEWYKNYYGKK